jgi:hypothetical protein
MTVSFVRKTPNKPSTNKGMKVNHAVHTEPKASKVLRLSGCGAPWKNA